MLNVGSSAVCSPPLALPVPFDKCAHVGETLQRVLVRGVVGAQAHVEVVRLRRPAQGCDSCCFCRLSFPPQGSSALPVLVLDDGIPGGLEQHLVASDFGADCALGLGFAAVHADAKGELCFQRSSPVALHRLLVHFRKARRES